MLNLIGLALSVGLVVGLAVGVATTEFGAAIGVSAGEVRKLSPAYWQSSLDRTHVHTSSLGELTPAWDPHLLPDWTPQRKQSPRSHAQRTLAIGQTHTGNELSSIASPGGHVVLGSQPGAILAY